MKKFFKNFFKVLGILLLVLVVAVGGLLGWLTVREYKPAPTEQLEAIQNSSQTPSGTSFTVLSHNVGYCALGAESDFFMDGGTQTRPESAQIVEKNLAGIREELATLDPDFVFLQEVDTDSHRSFGVNEQVELLDGTAWAASYALNYSCDFVPVPLPPLGKVHSGLLTLSKYQLDSPERIALPCPFSWPLSIANLKRCLLVNRVALEGGKELVLVNLHLEAYDDGEGKIAQTKQLVDFLNAEYEKGNYVIAGGDFNQVFPDTLRTYPNTHEENWTPGVLEPMERGLAYAWDDSVPTCRLLNQPYDPADTVNTQYYVIDGFIVSANVTVDRVETLDEGFAYADHNPVLLTFTVD